MAKYLDLAGLTSYDGKLKEWIKSGVVDITDDAINALFVVGPADNEIWYTSKSGNVITPYKTGVFGANIVSNTYENGKGVITFDGPVTSIGSWAFRNCSSLTSITIPNSVENIGNYAFNSCSSLTSVTIGNSVTSIAYYAFSDCSSLTSIVVEMGNTIYDNRDNCNAIIETATNTLIAGCQSTIIPNSVTSIGERAFVSCSSLTSIAIPNSVTSIGNYAFEYCTSLTSVTIGNSVTSIGERAFSVCSSLTSITIPNSVTSIGGETFAYCSDLTSITFEGTIEQWNSITKGIDWKYDVPATYVQCTDGQVTL